MKKGKILKKEEGLTVVRLEGSPYEMGYQHGKALRNEIKYFASNLKDLFARYEGILGKLAFPIFRFASKILEKNIPKEFREEMRGISDSAGVDYNSIRLENLTEELGKIFYSYLKPFIPFKCSCFVTKDADGKIIWGRNLDYLFYEVLPGVNIVFVYVPQNGFPFISLAWPGVISAPTGISRDFSLILLSSSTNSRLFNGIAQGILTRQVIQYSQSLEDGLRKIISLSATIGQNLVLVSKNDAKVIEVSPRKKAIRSFRDQAITVTNHFQIKEMEKEQVSPIAPRSIPDEFFSLFFTLEGSKKRAEKMKMALSQSQGIDIDPKRAMEILDQVAGPGTIQSVVCIPQKEEFWVAKRSQPPVTKGEWLHLSIDDLL
jgi:predicted choloylglycine hydrolase